MRRRIVITGVGAVSALGIGREQTWEGLRSGRTGIAPIAAGTVASFANVAEVKDFVAADHLGREDLMLDRTVQFALLAAQEAMADAGLELSDEQKIRSAVVTGCACGGKETEDAAYEKLYRQGKKRNHPLTVPKIMANAGAGRISLEFGLQGPVFNLSTACASSTHAIGQALWLLRSGVADRALVGGHEASLVEGDLCGWDALRVVAPDTCRPFSVDRQGMVLGEGAGILVLETLEDATARGAKIYAEVLGFGMTADAHHLTLPSVDGPTRAMANALADAGVEPETVGYINAHGTGTPANDPNETAAIRAVLGDQADRALVSSTKSMHGHALGAAGALEAVATVLALETGVVPPTANFTEPDPECNLDYVPNEAREASLDVALSNSFAFGGLNAVVAFRRFR